MAHSGFQRLGRFPVLESGICPLQCWIQESQEVPPMAIAEPTPAVVTGADRRFVLYDVSWRFYEAFLAEMAERRIFLTYDRGTLEIMSPSEKHGRSSCLLGRLVEILTEELDIPVDG